MGFTISRCVNDMCKHSHSDVFAVRKNISSISTKYEEKIFLRYLLNMKKNISSISINQRRDEPLAFLVTNN